MREKGEGKQFPNQWQPKQAKLLTLKELLLAPYYGRTSKVLELHDLVNIGNKVGSLAQYMQRPLVHTSVSHTPIARVDLAA